MLVDWQREREREIIKKSRPSQALSSTRIKHWHTYEATSQSPRATLSSHRTGMLPAHADTSTPISHEYHLSFVDFHTLRDTHTHSTVGLND